MEDDTTYTTRLPQSPGFSGSVQQTHISSLGQVGLTIAPKVPQLWEMPLDVLLDIAGCLDWRDILCLRQTCTRLNKVSRERFVWLDLLSRYEPTFDPRRHWPDRPLLNYDGEELEELVLRPFKVDAAWNTDDIAPALQRSFTVPTPVNMKLAELIRGGRWLLYGIPGGSVAYLDLESQVIRPQTLLPFPVDDTEAHVFPRFTVDMDDDAPYLTFNVVVFPQYEELIQYALPSQIWKVKAVTDDQGRVTDLAAILAVSWYADTDGCIPGLSLRKNLLAYAYGAKAIILDWNELESTTQLKRIIPSRCEYVSLLRNGWIIVYHFGYFDIYRLGDIPQTSTRLYNGDCIPAKRMKAHSSVRNISKPFEKRESTRLFYHHSGMRAATRAITLPHADYSKASSVQVLALYRGSRLEMCCEDAVWIDKGTVSMLGFDLVGRLSKRCSQKDAQLLGEVRGVLMDRCSGRIIVAHELETDFTILDFRLS